MGVSAGPDIVEDGLILHLDSSSANSYDPNDRYENLFSYSEDMSNNVWGGYCGQKTNQTYNTTDVVAPDGTNTATKIVRGSNGCDGTLSWGIIWNQNVGGEVIAGVGLTYTASIYARGAKGGESVNLGLSDSRQSTYKLTTEWQRISYTAAAAITGRGLQCICNDLNETIYLWGAQVESGPTTGEYYKTSGTAKTRGTAWSDLSYSGSNAVLQEDIRYNTAGRIQFDGDNGYVQFPSTTISRNGGAFSIWFYVDDFTDFNAGKTVPSRVLVRGDNDYQRVIALYEGGFGYETNTNSNPKDIASDQISDYSNSQITSGKWINFVMSNENSQSTFYINGTLDRTLTVSDNLQLAYIGRGQSPTNYPSFFKGKVSNFKIYNRALTADEVQKNFDALRGRFGI